MPWQHLTPGHCRGDPLCRPGDRPACGRVFEKAGLSVLVLDENVFASQRAQLRQRRMRPCQIGRDIGRKGMEDDEIIPMLRELRRSTFVSRDRDFFDKTLCHDRICLVYLDVRPLEVAEY